jgi:hypothetical protein
MRTSKADVMAKLAAHRCHYNAIRLDQARHLGFSAGTNLMTKPEPHKP